MQYIGNYESWIKQEWMDYMISNQGFARPGNKVLENDFEIQQNKFCANQGYTNFTYMYKFEPENFPFELSIPLENETCIMWWFIKMLPGNLLPMHTDQETSIGEKINLYWMALTDYQPGHVLICADQFLSNYKKGDLFKFDNANDLHGSCNIGFTTRLVFNFTTIKE